MTGGARATGPSHDSRKLDMKIANKYIVPDRCPSDCPGIETYRKYALDDPCRICPVFLCKTVVYEGETINLLPPEKYPRGQAVAWEKWFKGEMKGKVPGMDAGSRRTRSRQ